MATTSVRGHGLLSLGGSADVEFVHGPQAASNVQFLWDFDNDGDFDSDEENVTTYIVEAEARTGRDWPSQLQGKAGPGRLQMRMVNDDDRFSYFNDDSPLNQNGNSLDPGARFRIQVEGTTGVDPVLLVHDRFDGTGAITTDELGTPWEHQATGSSLIRTDGTASIFASPNATAEMVIDTGETDYYVQMTIAVVGDNVLFDAGVQENNEIRLIYRWQDSDDYSYLAFYPFDGIQVHSVEAFDVVAGTPTSIFGPVSDVGSGGSGVDSEGDHRSRVTIGAHVVDDEVNYYVNGCKITSSPETALQTDETHVGIHMYYGLTNSSPQIDTFAVYDTLPVGTDGVIWTGKILDVFPEAIAGPQKYVRVTAEGTLTELAGASIKPSAWAGRMKTGIAVGDAIERAGLLYPPGELDLGDAYAGSSSSVEIAALAHARKMEEVEIGFLHEAPEGWLVYQDRSYREALDTTASFSDADDAQYHYETFELLPWRREIINKISAGVSYGSPNLIVVGGGSNGGTSSGVQQSIGFTFPASVNDGDLFVVLVVSTVADDDEGWLVPLWWVRNRDTGASSSKRTQVYTHIAAASEASSAVTFYADAASAGGSFITAYYQIRDWYGSHEGIHIGTWAIGNSFLGADPEPILPPWGDINPSALIAQRAGVSNGGAGAITDPTYPLGYVNSLSVFQNGSGSNVHDCGLLVATKLAMTALDDPSTFTGFTNLLAETSVIAIRGRNGSPAEPRGRLRVTVEDADSQRKHNIVATYNGTDVFPSEDLAETWCNLMLTRYSGIRPIIRLSFTATKSSSYRAQAYLRRLSDKIHVTATNNAGMGIDDDFHIESITHRWTKGTTHWTVTWELSPAG